VTAVLQSPVVVSPTLVISVLAGTLAGVAVVKAVLALRSATETVYGDIARPFSLTAFVVAVCAFGHPVVARTIPASVMSIVPLMTFLFLFLPWNVFAFRYAGWGHLLTRRRTIAVAVPVASLSVVYAGVAVGVLRPAQEFYSSILLLTSTVLLGLVAFATVSSGLVLLAAYRHESMPVTDGLVSIVPVAVVVAAIQVVSLSQFLTRDLLTAFHLLVAAGAFPVAVVRYDVLRTRPGTSTLGERTIVEEFDEAMLVVDADGEVVRSNQHAEEFFGVNIEGERFEAVLGHTPTALRESETLERWTDRGYRRFDPRVSTMCGGDGQTLGYTVTLLDVTDRRVLQQRIQVLNRILRHNIRNKLDVINANVEAARQNGRGDDGDGDGDLRGMSDERLATVGAVTDEIDRMSAKARRIEKLIREPTDEDGPVDLAAFVPRVVAATADEYGEVTVSVDVRPLELSLDRSLLRFALTNLVENAITHNTDVDPRVVVSGDRTDSGVRLVVADNGPGIPETEWEVIRTGREDPTTHATSIGLWGTKWAVQTLSGDLSLEESDLGGAAVVIDLPVDRETGVER
jgi:signal transduction histidine kinase